MRGLLLNADTQVAAWAFHTYNRIPMLVDRAIGVIDDDGLVGAALFHSCNSVNAEFSYYGKNTFTVGIVRALARIALYELHLARVTVIVPKRPAYLIKKLQKFGFRFEGVQRRYYGPTDAPRHTGCRFVAFKEDLDRLAKLTSEKVA
jgi:RimJ/RimL family protein N-acetyltransferase